MNIYIGTKPIGIDHPTLFIAEIGSNHEASLDRAVELIHLAKKSGADAVKFQSFRADKIVSKNGFDSLPKMAHQSKWEDDVYTVYRKASLPVEWIPLLYEECKKIGIIFLSTPYDLEMVDILDPYVEAFKIGSGDITWPDMLRKVTSKKKPILLSTGASSSEDVIRAVRQILLENKNAELILMQCNTNYTGNLENYSFANLNVLRTYQEHFKYHWPIQYGFSDHTLGLDCVLGAVSLGARVIEKHFTDNPSRSGPDHKFAMSPHEWREMIDATRILERALGNGVKIVEENEKESIIVQRRCLRASRDIAKDEIITSEMIDVLRPAHIGSIAPTNDLLGRRVKFPIFYGDHFTWAHFK